ncbi:hypothetical protein MMC06_003461 [Schaereria dolodes]|nr:hypothetical protein [Schaereria dolodes]
MYTTSHPVSTSMNGMGTNMIDGSGTINPAALNTSASVLPTATSVNPPIASPRGIKRSRSPDIYGDLPLGGEGDDDTQFLWMAANLWATFPDDQKPRKRGRPPKSRLSGGGSDNASIAQPQQIAQPLPPQLRTPQLQTQGLSQPQQTNVTPTQTSPPKATPTKAAVVKALPTVRDHTTDQLSPEGDEYVPREYDEAGEKKVSPTGRPLEGREYKCRTFLVPNRGDKLFMLATECARVLGYRDSYLLFNKNRSLYKIIATQPEKDDLIHQEILPYSYRSRQIAIVTAKSMFRQFGSRVISNGRRVRDDYWEAKARKQGFTEEDLAGEKRPGGAKAARDAAAQEAANAAALSHHPDIIYNNGPGPIPIDAHGQHHSLQNALGGAMPATLAPLPMIHLAPSDDMRLRDYGNIARPRQEITGTPYQDRTQPSSAAEIMNQATHTADFSKVLNQQSRYRQKTQEDFYIKQRELPVSTPQQQPSEPSPALSQPLQSPPLTSGGLMNATGQQPLLQHQSSQLMASHQPYSQQPHHQNPLAQSPIRSVAQSQMHQRSSGLAYGTNQSSSPYGYQQPSQQQQIWGQPPPQPHQSPISTHGHPGLPQYGSQQQHQPHPHQNQQSPHPSQSPHQPPPQLQHTQSSGSIHHGGMGGYQGVQNLSSGGYGTSLGGRNMYQQVGQNQQQYLQGQTSAGSQTGLQGWAPPGGQSQHGGQGQGWQGY